MFQFKGWIGEKKTAFRMWLGLNKGVYQRVHNIILPSQNGTAQIDHLILSPFGIFIVETKNKKGWIYGSKNQAKWTQVIYQRKYYFQNPLRQIYRQKKVVADFLDIPESKIHTMVYFVGSCEFKTKVPDNVGQSGLIPYIKSFKTRIISQGELERIAEQLNEFLAISKLTRRDHIRSVKDRLNSETICPRCGGDLVLRTAKKGINQGFQFLGCSNYPKCKYTKNFWSD